MVHPPSRMANGSSISSGRFGKVAFGLVFVNFIPEEIHVLATRLATYVSSDSTAAKVTNR
jgi:hypothetical protein